VNGAGCTKCGLIHNCCENINMNRNCPLIISDDESRVCEITGLSISCLRTSNKEYIQTCVFDTHSMNRQHENLMEKIFEKVTCIIHTFLLNPKISVFKKIENEKKISKLQMIVTKTLKTLKNTPNFKIPNIHDIVASTLIQAQMSCSLLPTEKLITECVFCISKCVFDLNIYSVIVTKPELVIGILYLLKAGLCVNNVFFLVPIKKLGYYLPQENSLERGFGYPIKLICETENEIKTLIRKQKHLL
jgi:hypothetical protein